MHVLNLKRPPSGKHVDRILLAVTLVLIAVLFIQL